MTLIYEPSGPAREYAALACNLYKGCEHGCTYCYAPRFAYRAASKEQQRLRFSKTRVVGGTNYSDAKRARMALKELARLAPRHVNGPRVLMSFTTDPYQPYEEVMNLTRDAITVLGTAGVKITILTKAPYRAWVRDNELFVRYNVELATTICWQDDDKRKQWEPKASPLEDRYIALKKARAAGLPTWVSVEPVIEADEGLAAITKLCGLVDLLKIGPVDRRFHQDAYDKTDWPQFLRNALEVLSKAGQRYYIKDALWTHATDEVRDRYKKERL